MYIYNAETLAYFTLAHLDGIKPKHLRNQQEHFVCDCPFKRVGQLGECYFCFLVAGKWNLFCHFPRDNSDGFHSYVHIVFFVRLLFTAKGLSQTVIKDIVSRDW